MVPVAVVLGWLVLQVLVESAGGSDGPIVSCVLLKTEATKLDVGSVRVTRLSFRLSPAGCYAWLFMVTINDAAEWVFPPLASLG